MKYAYFDTSYIVKLYCLEPGVLKIKKELEQYEAIATSMHGHGEFVSSLHRKVREKSMTHGQMRAVLHQFHQDHEAGLIHLYPSTPEIFQRMESVYLQAPPETFLRAVDALHLATAAEHGFSSLYSSDIHLLAAAPLFDLKGINLL